jgi:nitrogen regulatory protein P-II 1
MEFKKVTAILRPEVMDQVEARLQQEGIRGITVTPVKGYGEYANYFRRDMMVRHFRLEIFTQAERVEKIVETIADAAHSGVPGDGFIAVLPVERLFRIRTKSAATSHDL